MFSSPSWSALNKPFWLDVGNVLFYLNVADSKRPAQESVPVNDEGHKTGRANKAVERRECCKYEAHNGSSAAASGSASDGWVVMLAAGTRDGVAEVVRQGIVWAVRVAGAAPPRAAALVGGWVAGHGPHSRGRRSAGGPAAMAG